jgi:hypothetical protein
MTPEVNRQLLRFMNAYTHPLFRDEPVKNYDHTGQVRSVAFLAMPLTIIQKSGFLFGVPDELPELGKGFTTHAAVDEWVSATDESGNVYLIEDGETQWTLHAISHREGHTLTLRKFVIIIPKTQ